MLTCNSFEQAEESSFYRQHMTCETRIGEAGFALEDFLLWLPAPEARLADFSGTYQGVEGASSHGNTHFSGIPVSPNGFGKECYFYIKACIDSSEHRMSYFFCLCLLEGQNRMCQYHPSYLKSLLSSRSVVSRRMPLGVKRGAMVENFELLCQLCKQSTSE